MKKAIKSGITEMMPLFYSPLFNIWSLIRLQIYSNLPWHSQVREESFEMWESAPFWKCFTWNKLKSTFHLLSLFFEIFVDFIHQ